MSDPAQLLVDHLDTWTGAIERKNGSGRGNGGKISLHGIDTLRSLILNLAVRGKLVAQDPADGDAGELLASIRAARAEPQKPKPERSSQGPFALPRGWLWCRLSDVVDLENGDRGKNYPNKSTLVNEGVPFVNAGHLQNGLIDEERMTFISRSHYERLSGGKFREGDILFCLRGSLGKSAIVRGIEEGAIASSLVIIRNHGRFDNEYLRIFFDSPLSEVLIRKFDNGTAQPNLSSRSLGKFDFPLPPLAEQKRIVAKVDELMALVNALEAGTRDAMATHETLVRELLATLVNSQDADDLAVNWSRIEAHFDDLFTTEESIDLLKQSVLQLAIRGMLVSQSESAQPASKLLDSIESWRNKAIREKKIRPSRKPLAAVTKEDWPFSKPTGWVFSRLGELIYIKSGDGLTAANMREGDIPVYGGNGVNGYHDSSNTDRPTVVIGRVGYYCGSIHLTPTKAWVTDNAFKTEFDSDSINIDFLILLLTGTNLKENENATAQPVISGSKIYPIIVGLPPICEQRRIVEKYNHIMQRCDELYEALHRSLNTSRRIADSVSILTS
ncbi:restriction endonuclease subunit S [Hyphococcus formosus]|uniref:restriction endonuclease subunit S n=1 Tax=Hyphococcus formosus TaxID=3143534 RepID=UPI00398A6937